MKTDMIMNLCAACAHGLRRDGRKVFPITRMGERGKCALCGAMRVSQSYRVSGEVEK